MEFEAYVIHADPLDEKVKSLLVAKQLVQILYNVHIGNIKESPVLLTSLHSMVKSPNFENNQLIDYGQYCIRSIPFFMAYLVSGLAHKASDNQKAKIFFMEGLKALECI